MGRLLRQAGAIPYRIVDGTVEILLLTSRDTRRWVIPKGYVDPGMTTRQAACQEAWEEAGVSGEITTRYPLGFVPYFKTLRTGRIRAASIEVFPLLVERQKTRWREKKQRVRVWFPVRDAAARVAEPALATLMLRLEEIVLGPREELQMASPFP